jgi:EpsI family protein
LRTVNVLKAIILMLMFALTGLTIRITKAGPRDIRDRIPIGSAFDSMQKWRGAENYPVSDAIAQALKVDDCLYRSYRRGEDEVVLYVGYYRSAEKVGAAHDPLVCFLGQGWTVSDRGSGTYLISNERETQVSFSTMIAERETERELIVYWFQTGSTASADTFAQKLAMVWERIRGRNEENAFIRISARIGPEATAEVRRNIFDFVDEFYPILYVYISRQ